MLGDLIPCPVCGGELRVVCGDAHKFVDCEQRHHASTDAVLYEELRVRMVIEEIERFVGTGPEGRGCTDHDWTPIEEHLDLRLLICRGCLAVAVVAGTR